MKLRRYFRQSIGGFEGTATQERQKNVAFVADLYGSIDSNRFRNNTNCSPTKFTAGVYKP